MPTLYTQHAVVTLHPGDAHAPIRFYRDDLGLDKPSKALREVSKMVLPELVQFICLDLECQGFEIEYTQGFGDGLMMIFRRLPTIGSISASYGGN